MLHDSDSYWNLVEQWIRSWLPSLLGGMCESTPMRFFDEYTAKVRASCAVFDVVARLKYLVFHFMLHLSSHPFTLGSPEVSLFKHTFAWIYVSSSA